MAGPDLSILLSRVLVPLVWELDDAPPAAGSLAIWAGLLRVLDEPGTRAELGWRSQVSARTLHVLVRVAATLELVTAGPKAADVVTLTHAGRAARNAWASHLRSTEERWLEGHATRPVLEAGAAVLDALDLQLALPWLQMTYGPSDLSVALGARAPAPSSYGDLPLLGVLSHLLTIFDLRYAMLPRWPLSVNATTISRIPDEGTPLAAVHPYAGVAGNGKSLLERHGWVVVESGVVHLTASGRQVRDAFDDDVAGVERDLVEAAGKKPVGDLRKALAASAKTLPSKHVAHLCIGYATGLTGFVERNPRAGRP